VPISETPDATLRCRQKQRNYSGVQSDRTMTATYGCGRTGCEAKALQRSLPDLRGKFLDASAWRSDCFPLRPNGVTIRSQGTKAPVKTLVARDRRSPLTTWRMSRDSQRFLLQGPLFPKQALAQIAKSGGLRFRSELPAVLASGRGGRQCWRFLTRTRARYAQPH